MGLVREFLARPHNRWLAELVHDLRPQLREAALFSFFINLLALSVPIFTLQVYDRVVFYAGLSTLAALVIGMAFVVAFDLVVRQARARLLQRVALTVDVDAGRRLFDKFLDAPLRELERRSTGYWLTLFRDVDVIRNGLSGSTFVLATDLPFAVLFLGLLWVIAWPIAWIPMLAVVGFGLLAWRSGIVVHDDQAKERESSFRRDAFLAEVITGRTTLKALALSKRFRAQWEEQHGKNISHALDRGRHSDHYLHLSKALAMAVPIAMTSLGAIAILQQQMTIGSLIAANILCARIIGPFNQLLGNWRSYMGFAQAAERIGHALEIPDERNTLTLRPRRPKGELRLENVRFRYEPESAPALDDISVRFTPGNVYGVVGPNGSGKSTLLRVLAGLYEPERGQAKIDKADLAQFTRGQLANWIGYVPQELFLFDGTIRENILAGREGIADDEIMRVAHSVGLHAYVIGLPDGYASPVGEGGTLLSGGLRQRLALARALIGNPPVLLCDEPSSHLDRAGEVGLRRLFCGFASDHTVILVTHSPVLLSSCAQLVALRRGRIFAAGTPEEVVPQLRVQALHPAPAAESA